MKELSELERSRNKFFVVHKELQDHLSFIYYKNRSTLRYKLLKLFGRTG